MTYSSMVIRSEWCFPISANWSLFELSMRLFQPRSAPDRATTSMGDSNSFTPHMIHGNFSLCAIQSVREIERKNQHVFGSVRWQLDAL